MNALQVRRFAPSDSLDELTSMLHRAFSGLGRMGLNCASVNQSTATTACRARLGECLVAVRESRLVGTITLHKAERRSHCHWYRKPDVASLHQFAVDPSYQRTGCGEALLLAATHWAGEHGFGELALDTPAPADHLVQFYRSRGFRIVEQVQFQGKNYRSCVLSKPVDTTPMTSLPRLHSQPPRRAGWCGVMVQW